MQRARLYPLSLLALGLALGYGAASAGEREDKARELAALSGAGALEEGLRARLARELTRRAELMGGEPELRKLAAAIEAQEGGEALEQSVAESYAKRLTPAEVDALLAFYATPTGKAIAAKRGQLWIDEQDAIEARAQQVLAKAMGVAKLPSPEENLREARQNANEAAAIGALKLLVSAQTLFREGDKDGDGVLQYADSLAALGKVDLIDKVLAKGEKQGYRFKVARAPGAAGQFVWWATAEPIEPGKTGQRYFGANMAGLLYFSAKGPLEFDKDTGECRNGSVLGR